ncbi:MAG: ATP-binding protein [Terracidiphilus sp.]
MDFNVEMSDDTLLSRLRNEEDHFVERKTTSDINDCVKTVVAFANSAPIGMPCVLYVGAYYDGSFEQKTIDFDSIQKSLNNKLKSVYPRVPYVARVLNSGVNQVLAVIVVGSEFRPHFAGPSYIRIGSESKEATTEQLSLLIAQRSSKFYRISLDIGKQATIKTKNIFGNNTFSEMQDIASIVDCNESWITVQFDGTRIDSYPLSSVELSYDNNAKRLLLHVTRYQSY